MRFATEQRRTVFTANQADYFGISGSLLRSGATHAGIIIASQSLDIGQKIRRLHVLLNALPPEDMSDRVELLSNWPEQ